MAAQAGEGEPAAVVGVAVFGVELDGQLEVAQGELGGIDHQVGPAPECLDGRGGVELERLGEVFDRAGVLAELGPSQAAAAVDRLERLAGFEVTVKRLDDLGETPQPEQGLGPQALSQRVVFLESERRVETRRPLRPACRL